MSANGLVRLLLLLSLVACSEAPGGSASGAGAAALTPADPVFDQPAQPLPFTGQVGAGEQGPAPLEIRTRSDGFHYLVKITVPGSTAPVSQFFIRSGESMDAAVPLGSYEIKYASGRTWYGEKLLFGPETSYSKAEQIFRFTDDGGQISGYTVELFTQVNGNLRTSGIPASAF